MATWEPSRYARTQRFRSSPTPASMTGRRIKPARRPGQLPGDPHRSPTRCHQLPGHTTPGGSRPDYSRRPSTVQRGNDSSRRVFRERGHTPMGSSDRAPCTCMPFPPQKAALPQPRHADLHGHTTKECCQRRDQQLQGRQDPAAPQGTTRLPRVPPNTRSLIMSARWPKTSAPASRAERRISRLACRPRRHHP